MSDEPIIRPKDREDEQLINYLFELYGYLILKEAVAVDDVAEMNAWADEHQPYMNDVRPQQGHENSRWIGHVETHTYSGADGINFQNILEGSAVFERLIDHPIWIDHVRRFVDAERNGLSLHETLLNIRGRGGYIGIHSGGHLSIPYMTFRQPNTGAWMVGQINVITALNDIGPGDGATTIVRGSHKSALPHPKLAKIANSVYRSDEAAGIAAGMRELHLDRGDVLMFTDAITHGSAERTNAGYRRTVLYRYSPQWIRTRFNYEPSEPLLTRLTNEQRKIVQPLDPRRPPV
ncbi:MAG: phytanoyl-CoA dioxygenase family protein [Candidatus Latescibacterota bacterium]|nr:phytanoyl-CoA dioxygenase family protein [Candidatus Latescibacterota bacterium]